MRTAAIIGANRAASASHQQRPHIFNQELACVARNFCRNPAHGVLMPDLSVSFVCPALLCWKQRIKSLKNSGERSGALGSGHRINLIEQQNLHLSRIMDGLPARGRADTGLVLHRAVLAELYLGGDPQTRWSLACQGRCGISGIWATAAPREQQGQQPAEWLGHLPMGLQQPPGGASQWQRLAEHSGLQRHLASPTPAPALPGWRRLMAQAAGCDRPTA